nr:TPA_asm: m18A ORF [Murid betaherpesvirus 1]DBA07932.1 TPA_asm: m18A ORF [Murid betaherpesvirus 1]
MGASFVRIVRGGAVERSEEIWNREGESGSCRLSSYRRYSERRLQSGDDSGEAREEEPTCRQSRAVQLRFVPRTPRGRYRQHPVPRRARRFFRDRDAGHEAAAVAAAIVEIRLDLAQPDEPDLYDYDTLQLPDTQEVARQTDDRHGDLRPHRTCPDIQEATVSRRASVRRYFS